jgi:hypothetical protein
VHVVLVDACAHVVLVSACIVRMGHLRWAGLVIDGGRGQCTHVVENTIDVTAHGEEQC